jgi:ectoine hydroxylase-related dioxygenase (phytanoyl-CoA dioxygenase family)
MTDMSTPTTTLTAEQVAQFARDGYLVLPPVFTPQEIEACRSEADRILELMVNASLAHRENDPRTNMTVWPDGSLTMRKVQPINDLSDVLAAVSADERLIGPMRRLMGAEPLLMEEKLNYKQRVPVSAADLSCLITTVANDHFPLHHDWGYYVYQGYPENTISSAIAFDDCADRGPIRVLPGSHMLDPEPLDGDRLSGDGRVVPDPFEDAVRVPIDAEAGSVMFFHARLLHDSDPNLSGLPRRMMIYSHYPADHGGDPDRRNGPMRVRATAFEDEYRAMVADGRYTDLFHLT